MEKELLEKKIDEIVAKNGISNVTPGMSLMITKGNEVLFKKGYGMADLEQKVAISPDDNFIIASNTKQFTCFAILMLKERGLLTLDETVERFFPEFPDYVKRITIRQMMCHTTGIREYFEEGFRVNEEALRSADTKKLLEIVKGFGGELNFEPDTQFSYCNSAYVMLGNIVEQLTGKGFGEFLETEIFEPLGMNHTFAPDYMNQRDPYLVQGYKKQEDGSFQAEPYDMLMVGYADGNISSNTEDLFTWHKYLYQNDSELLLSRKTLAEAFQSHVLKDGKKTYYGFGFFLGPCKETSKEYEGHGEIWHTGGTAGFISRCSRFTADDVTLTMLTNYEGIEKDAYFFPIADAFFMEFAK